MRDAKMPEVTSRECVDIRLAAKPSVDIYMSVL